MRNLKNQLIGLDSRFRYRGKNQTRLETFSDAVFGVAFTLVVLSYPVPDTFDDLKKFIYDILPSFMSVLLIVVIWYQHYVFFLRYGLQNISVVTINTLLAFLVLIYVYPLKFLARFLVYFYSNWIFGTEINFGEKFGEPITSDNMKLLMTAYGIGAMAIFMSISWLYRYAYKKRKELKLNEYEVFNTKISLWQNLIMSSIPFLSALISLLHPFPSRAINFTVAGFLYMLYPPVMITFGYLVRKKENYLFPIKNDSEL